MEQRKKYFAFISYARNDIKWAQWLRDKLEQYQVPKEILSKNTSLSNPLRPIFLDVNELSSGVLADEIQKALQNSKYLIVICSPNAAQSVWLGKEVQTFIDLGRVNKIIPFIIGGTPYAQNPKDECLPFCLLKEQIIGIDVREGKEIAVQKVIARVLNIRFDVMWDRYSRKRRVLPTLINILLSPITIIRDTINSNINNLSQDEIDNYSPQKNDTEIFISYRKIDGRDPARTIEQALSKVYNNVFFDYDSIQDGKFNLQIIDAIYSCRDFILILSPKSMKRCHRKGDWVAAEIRAALKYKKHIIPVVIENSNGNKFQKWPRNFPEDLMEIQNLQQLDFRMDNYFPRAMDFLLQRVEAPHSKQSSSQKSSFQLFDEKDTNYANIKIKQSYPCKLFIDDEEWPNVIEENSLIKVPLRKGEYLVRIVLLKDDKTIIEEKIDLVKDKLYCNL